MSSSFPRANSSKTSVPPDDLPVEIEGFTEEEKREIASQIDEAAKSSTIGTGTAFSEFAPQKKGAFFPLIVNILAVLLIGGGIYLSNFYFNQRVDQLTTEARGIQSAEGKILEEVKKESEQKLQAKEAEISEIRQNLNRIEQERQNLQANMEEQISQKEVELRRELEAALAQERARLESEGISQENLEEQLQAFRAQQESRYQESLDQFRQESMAQLQEKERELEEAKATAERILEEANREKEQLIEDAEQREAELRQEFQAERERLSEQSNEAQQELSRLEEVRRNEQLYRDRVNEMYLDVQDAIEAGEAQQAREILGELRSFLQDASVQPMTSLATRREVDAFLIGVLEQRAASAGSSREDESLLEAAKTISALRATVKEAQALQQEEKLYDARRYYAQAIEMLPAVRTAVEELETIQSEEEAVQIREILSEADTMAEEGDIDQALELYTKAAIESSIRHRPLSRQSVEGMSALLEVQLAQQRAAHSEELAEYEEDIKALQGQRAELQGQRQELEKQLAEARSAYQQIQEQSGEELSSLNSSIEEKDSRINTLQQEIQTKEREITELETDLATIEREKADLNRQYNEAQGRITSLKTDLEGAVDQIAELVTLGESNSRLRSAVKRYEEFEQRSQALLSSPDNSSVEASRAEFERFLESEEVSELFPQLSELYSRLH